MSDRGRGVENDHPLGDLGDPIAVLIGKAQYICEPGIPANHVNIRAICAAVENRNPAYWDDQALGWCPATMLPAWGRPELWEPAQHVPIKALQAHFDLKDMLGFPASMAVSYTMSHFLPVRIGDRLRTQQVLQNVSGIKTTKVGRGRFWTIEMQYLDDASELVGVETYEFFGFEKDSA